MEYEKKKKISETDNSTTPCEVVKESSNYAYPERHSKKTFIAGTIEILQRASIFKVNCCLKVLKSHLGQVLLLKVWYYFPVTHFLPKQHNWFRYLRINSWNVISSCVHPNIKLTIP